MSYRITSYESLQENLSIAGTTIMLCRANLEQAALSQEEMRELLWRIERQIAELKGIQAELEYMSQRMRTLQRLIKPRLRLVD